MPSNKKVFISYSRADSTAVFSLVEKLQKKIGDVFWIDQNGIESGDQFIKIIIKAIDNADVILFMHSANALNSEWVQKEINYAQGKHKKIVPVLIDGKTLDGWFLFQFGGNDFIDSANDIHCNKLLRNLKEWLEISTDFEYEGRFTDSEENIATAKKEFSQITDPRDGQIYKTVQIGKQIWLAENLRYRCDGSLAFNNSKKIAKEYGRLYTWSGAKKAIIPGWHLPSDKEFMELRKFANKLASINDNDILMAPTPYWSNVENTELRNALGFTALPAGWHIPPEYEDFDEDSDSDDDDDKDVKFFDLGSKTYFWSATESDIEGDIYALEIFSNKLSSGVDEERINANSMVSVRLIKD